MKKITEQELKQIEIEMLVNIADFCQHHELHYFLAYGTLLGAVRHKGFIPWDDDIDIQMPREDYDRFADLFNQQGGRYYAVTPYDPLSQHSYIKVIDTKTVKREHGLTYNTGDLGVDIDIFPIDGQPTDEQEYKKWYKKLAHCYYKYHYATVDIKQMKQQRWKVWVYKLLSGSKMHNLKKASALHKQYPLKDSEYIGTMESYVTVVKDRAPKSCYASSILMEFEGHNFNVPMDYDTVLKRLYGNYMQFPPKEQQVTHHNFVAYWKE